MKKKSPPDRILNFIFDQIGSDDPSDKELAEWAAACEASMAGLLGVIKDKKVREIAIENMNEATTICIKKISEALDALEHGELTVKEKLN